MISVGHKKIEDMKKTYIIPELETMDLKINQQLLAGSNPPVGGSTNNKDDLLAPEFDFDE